MNEVKSPKKPLLYYYLIVLLVVMLFNLLAMPWLAEHQIKDVDYNTFVSMTEQGQIGQVEIQQQSNRILFTGKDEKTIYKTAIVPDDGLVQRLLDEGRDELVPVLARRFLGKQYQDRSLVRLARLRSRNGRFFPCWMVLNNMEHLTRRFGVMLDAAVGQDAPPAPFRDAFSVQYENLTVYFLFRYALKAVNDRQYLARVEQCVFHLLCLRELSADAATVQELTEVVSLYSKEVEHSEDNQALLLKLFRRGTLRWQYLASILDF